MSIVDELIENLVERNALRLSGALSIKLLDGGISVTGTVVSVVRDQKKNKDVLKANIPINAQVKVPDIVIPVPQIV
jgi:hypothetical protein